MLINTLAPCCQSAPQVVGNMHIVVELYKPVCKDRWSTLSYIRCYIKADTCILEGLEYM